MNTHRIAHYADIHYSSDADANYYWTPPPNLDVEAILFAGDIHYTPLHVDKMFRAIRASQRPETMLVLVPGNNDYSDQELTSTRDAYKAVVGAIPNAIWLEDAMTELPSGLRIIGSPLWSFMDDDEIVRVTAALAEMGYQGVDKIRDGDRLITFEDANRFHLKARAFIENALHGRPASERARTIVCTHYWPSFQAIDTTNPNEVTWRQGCASNMDAFIKDYGPRFWIAGHLHTSKDFMIGQTRLISNPRVGEGPDGLNPAFQEMSVLEFVT